MDYLSTFALPFRRSRKDRFAVPKTPQRIQRSFNFYGWLNAAGECGDKILIGPLARSTRRAEAEEALHPGARSRPVQGGRPRRHDVRIRAAARAGCVWSGRRLRVGDVGNCVSEMSEMSERIGDCRDVAEIAVSSGCASRVRVVRRTTLRLLRFRSVGDSRDCGDCGDCGEREGGLHCAESGLLDCLAYREGNGRERGRVREIER